MKKIIDFYAAEDFGPVGRWAFPGFFGTAILALSSMLGGGVGTILLTERDAGVEGEAVSEKVEASYRQRLEVLRGNETRIVKIEKAVADLDTQVLIDDNTDIRSRFEAAKKKLSSEQANQRTGVQSYFNDLVMDKRLNETRVDDIAKDSARRLAYRYASSLVTGNTSGSEIYFNFSNGDLRECQIEGSTAAQVAACSEDRAFELGKNSALFSGGVTLGTLLLLPYAAAFRRRRKEGEAGNLSDVPAIAEPKDKIVSTNIKVTYVQPKKD